MFCMWTVNPKYMSPELSPFLSKHSFSFFVKTKSLLEGKLQKGFGDSGPHCIPMDKYCIPSSRFLNKFGILGCSQYSFDPCHKKQSILQLVMAQVFFMKRKRVFGKKKLGKEKKCKERHQRMFSIDIFPISRKGNCSKVQKVFMFL